MRKFMLLLIFSPAILFSQKYRVSNEKMKDLSSSDNYIYSMVLKVHNILDKNDSLLTAFRAGKPIKELDDPYFYFKYLGTTGDESIDMKLGIKNICVDCFKNEYKNQLSEYNICRKTQDSIENKKKVYQDSLVSLNENKRLVEEDKKTQINNSNIYDRITFELNNRSPYENRYITPFYGIDATYAVTRFSIFVLSKMEYTIDDDGIIDSNGTLSCKYVPTISYGGENKRFRLKCFYEERKDVKPYSKEMDKCYVIKKAEITGSFDIIVKLFVHYWRSTMTVGGYKNGEIAHCRLMGDYISLEGVSKGICKIVITKNPNIEMDYYKLF